MPEVPLWSRPEPKRIGPHRNGWARASHLRQVTDVAASTVEQAVTLGYQVIEDNMERGREFARKRSQSQHNHPPGPDELLQMSAKVIQLGREFSLAYFDLVEKTIFEMASIATRSKGHQADDSTVEDR
jgi:hypothetical protein